NAGRKSHTAGHTIREVEHVLTAHELEQHVARADRPAGEHEHVLFTGAHGHVHAVTDDPLFDDPAAHKYADAQNLRTCRSDGPHDSGHLAWAGLSGLSRLAHSVPPGANPDA